MAIGGLESELKETKSPNTAFLESGNESIIDPEEEHPLDAELSEEESIEPLPEIETLRAVVEVAVNKSSSSSGFSSESNTSELKEETNLAAVEESTSPSDEPEKVLKGK